MKSRVWLLILAPIAVAQTAIRDYKLDLPSDTVEIEGICKISEDDVACWTPKGVPSPSLTKDFEARLAYRNKLNFGPIQVPFVKKNRIFVLRYTPRKGYVSFGYSAGIDYDQAKFGQQTWETFVVPVDPNSPDKTHREFVMATYAKDAKQAEFAYQFTNLESRWVKIPFKTGQFTVGDNTYKISKIDDKGTSSDVTLEATHVVKPDDVMLMYPASDHGDPFSQVEFGTGNPVTKSIVDKEQYKAWMDSKAGKPFTFPNRNQATFWQIQSEKMMSQKSIKLNFNISPRKIKMISIQWGHKTRYKFEGISLDPVQ